MRDGKVVGNVKTSETNAKDLARMIVGRDVLLRVEKTDANPKEAVLNVENLSVSSKHGEALKDVSFNVRAGEIVGIAGIEGNGQTELIEAIAGFDAGSNSGTIELFRQRYHISIGAQTQRTRHRAYSRRPPQTRTSARFRSGGKFDSRRSLSSAGRGGRIFEFNRQSSKRARKKLSKISTCARRTPNSPAKISFRRQSAKTDYRQGI